MGLINRYRKWKANRIRKRMRDELRMRRLLDSFDRFPRFPELGNFFTGTWTNTTYTVNGKEVTADEFDEMVGEHFKRSRPKQEWPDVVD